MPGKNLRLLGGLPLIAHTIQQAQASSSISRLAVSTDCPLIAEVARKFGAEVPFLRPAHLATDEAGSVDVLLHAADYLAAEEIVLLQPTSPLRLPRHIDEAVALFRYREANSVISCRQAPPLEWHCREDAHHCLIPVADGLTPTRRQDTACTLLPNGSIYVVRRSALTSSRKILGERCYAYAMSASFSIDIDTLEDFLVAEAMLLSGVCNGLT